LHCRVRFPATSSSHSPETRNKHTVLDMYRGNILKLTPDESHIKKTLTFAPRFLSGLVRLPTTVLPHNLNATSIIYPYCVLRRC